MLAFARRLRDQQQHVNLVVELLILFLVVIWLALVYWTYADARRRIADPMLIGCATAASLFPFVGTIVYMIVRPPEYLDDVRERELEMQAAEARLAELGYHLCPHCDYEVEKDFLRCPNCMRKLKDPCETCGKPLDPTWKICPFCEAEIGAVPVQTRRARRRGQHLGAAGRRPRRGRRTLRSGIADAWQRRSPRAQPERQSRRAQHRRVRAQPSVDSLTDQLIERRPPPMERTLILVKPDAFARNLTGEIIARFERKGLRLVALEADDDDRASWPSALRRARGQAVLRRARRRSSPPGRWSRWCSRASRRSRPPAR